MRRNRAPGARVPTVVSKAKCIRVETLLTAPEVKNVLQSAAKVAGAKVAIGLGRGCDKAISNVQVSKLLICDSATLLILVQPELARPSLLLLLDFT